MGPLTAVWLPALLAHCVGATSPAPPVSLFYHTSNTGLGNRHDGSRWVKLLGKTGSLEACGVLCVELALGDDLRCRSFSRYTAQHQNASEAGDCYGHVDPAWLPLNSSDGSVDSGLVNWPCETDMDCSLNGQCGAAPPGVCRCSTGWQGDR